MKEKQIEEMAHEIFEHFNCRVRAEEAERIAKHLVVNADYHKQNEGKWLWIDQAIGYLDPPYGDTCKCSLCGFVIDVSNSYYKYCPNCGARMGGEHND